MLSKLKTTAKPKSQALKLSPTFNPCLSRFYSKQGLSRDDVLPEMQVMALLIAGTTIAISELPLADEKLTADEMAARNLSAAVIAFQGASTLFGLAFPKSNRTAKQIRDAKSAAMQGAVRSLLGDEAEAASEVSQKLTVDAGVLYAQIFATNAKALSDLDQAWTKFSQTSNKSDLARAARVYEFLVTAQLAKAAKQAA